MAAVRGRRIRARRDRAAVAGSGRRSHLERGRGGAGGSALHSAARRGNAPIVELLLDRGAGSERVRQCVRHRDVGCKKNARVAQLFARGGTLDCYDLIWLDEDDEAVRRVAADPREANAGCGGVFTAAATRRKKDLVLRLISNT